MECHCTLSQLLSLFKSLLSVGHSYGGGVVHFLFSHVNTSCLHVISSARRCASCDNGVVPFVCCGEFLGISYLNFSSFSLAVTDILFDLTIEI
jgi:hypothetical protein